MVVTVRQPESMRAVRYTVPSWSPAWAIPEVPVPESQLHDQAIEYLRAVLLAWAARWTGAWATYWRRTGGGERADAVQPRFQVTPRGRAEGSA